ncbi:hypothetical protein JQU17_03215 [Ponticoccus sp. SC2-23]|uniref:hypothetical protein n=1 Tax=Alexandriicola marinus TaxID=2081710 RepID=UPI0013DECD0F|nr:hypothetical protein [Alexandriicola marinus]MBM1219195.1 hypothetical protein [Ponticoccus sp. SC6-9]MBM1223733.1 hypothetical protein [Ponticoccus sp. SC6-15]MBM1232699.1 hypothetical protein [Ponticoccus sp. SC6-45]MBM1237351.1 hypothetical protein [Ponticoccus sp. SC6-49]MBM1241710.1 hypothetical protein [Ponticoccus sp. SC2-64]MBM1246223.1 hypothetical protein [Ponticoccus sp. SC6-42]MBM1250701.1 hypothetical protein [Ponticoccus sp. SC6-33]MBM1255360.1 hypothetical protein [Pontico
MSLLIHDLLYFEAPSKVMCTFSDPGRANFPVLTVRSGLFAGAALILALRDVHFTT